MDQYGDQDAAQQRDYDDEVGTYLNILEDLVPSHRYKFHTTDETVYVDAIYLSGDGDGIWISTSKTLPVKVFIAAHELAGVEEL